MEIREPSEFSYFLFGMAFAHGRPCRRVAESSAVIEWRNMKTETKTLTPERLRQMDAYGRAVYYLSVGQIYLDDNPLLKKPLTLGHINPRLLGHWGTTPGRARGR
jgi:hypothetical protein